MEALLARPNVQSPGEQDRFWSTFRAATEPASIRGDLVPDAHLVALMRQNDVGTIYTHDRDFRRFDGVEVIDRSERPAMLLGECGLPTPGTSRGKTSPTVLTWTGRLSRSRTRPAT